MEQILDAGTYCSVHLVFACVGEWPLQKKAFCLTTSMSFAGRLCAELLLLLGVLSQTQAGFQSSLDWMSQILNLAGFGCILQHSSGCGAVEVAAGLGGCRVSSAVL